LSPARLAVLLAARRDDVAGIVTIAGDIALRYWVARDHLAPLAGSLDPADAAPSLGALPQVHFVGGRDETVEPDVAQAYLARLPPGAPARLVAIPSYDHSCCWARDWKSLATRPELAIIPGWL
jgi:pimeloyl-ACP methyl ester carboxylesterase